MPSNPDSAFKQRVERQAPQQSQADKIKMVEEFLNIKDLMSGMSKELSQLPEDIRNDLSENIRTGVDSVVEEARKSGDAQKPLSKILVEISRLPLGSEIVAAIMALITVLVVAGCKEKGVETGDVKEAAIRVPMAKERADYQKKYVMREVRSLSEEELKKIEEAKKLLELPAEKFTLEQAKQLAEIWIICENANDKSKADFKKKVIDLIPYYRIRYTDDPHFKLIDVVGQYAQEIDTFEVKKRQMQEERAVDERARLKREKEEEKRQEEFKKLFPNSEKKGQTEAQY